MKRYVNQGHSVTTPADLKKAIESDEGIAGVRVTIVPVPKTTVDTKNIKWEGVTSLSNVEITAAGIRAFKAYGIGAGNFRSWTSFAGMHVSLNQTLLRQNCLRSNKIDLSPLYTVFRARALCLFGLKRDSETKQ